MLWRRKSGKIQEYKELRKSGRLLVQEIIKVIPKEAIMRTARDMNLLSKGVLVFDAENELDFLFDRIIHDVPWDGKAAIEHFEVENSSALSPMEEKLIEAHKKAYFSLFEAVGGVQGEFLQLSDLLGDGQIELTDINLSSLASKRFLLATRILNVGDIFMTAGVGYPFLSEQKETLISGLKTRQTSRQGRKKRSIRRMDFSGPRNYSLYFFRQYKKFGTLEMRMSEEL